MREIRPIDATPAEPVSGEKSRRSPAQVIGRYALYDEFASGGMASLHFGRLYGSAGFARTVAIKRLHSNLAGEAEFVSMLVDEARLAARIRHPNVVPTLDVVSSDGELLLVMEYVHGLSLAQLLSAAATAGKPCPVAVAMAIACDALRGLHAAHEAKSELGEPLELVHRDMSPQNVLVGADGVTRVVDFGVAKAAGRVQETREGELKGKIPYMAPEQLRGDAATRRSDIYGAGVVLWECLTGRRLFRGDNDAAVWLRVLNDTVKAPSAFTRGIPRDLDLVVLRATSKDPAQRFATAIEMAKEIESVLPLASPLEVSAWIEDLAAPVLQRRAELLARVEHAAAPSESSLPRTEMVGDETSVAAPVWQNRRIQLGALLLIALLGFSITALVLRSPSDAPPSITPATALPSIETAPTAPSASTATMTTTATAAEARPPELVVDFPETAAKPPPVVQGTVRQRIVKKPPAADCDPPFTIDSAGRKEYKQRCL